MLKEESFAAFQMTLLGGRCQNHNWFLPKRKLRDVGNQWHVAVLVVSRCRRLPRAPGSSAWSRAGQPPGRALVYCSDFRMLKWDLAGSETDMTDEPEKLVLLNSNFWVSSQQ